MQTCCMYYFIVLIIQLFDIIELAQLSCIWTEVLQIINLMLSCRGVGSPARRAPLRGERSWRRAAAAQKYYISKINKYKL